MELARPMSFHPSMYATRCPPCAGRCDTKLGPRRFLSAVEMADNSSGVKSHLPNVDAVDDELEVEVEDISLGKPRQLYPLLRKTCLPPFLIFRFRSSFLLNSYDFIWSLERRINNKPPVLAVGNHGPPLDNFPAIT